MLTISDEAQKEITAFFDANPDTPRVLRIYVTPGTCSGPVLSITTDQVDESDVTEVREGVTYCLDRQLQERVGSIAIGINEDGLTIKPERPLMDPSAFAGCSCCGGSCTSC